MLLATVEFVVVPLLCILTLCGCAGSCGMFHIVKNVVLTHIDKLSDQIQAAAWCFCIMSAANEQSAAAYAAAVNITGP